MNEKNELQSIEDIRDTIEFVQRNYKHIDIDELLQKSGLRREQIVNADAMFEPEQVERFQNILSEMIFTKEPLHNSKVIKTYIDLVEERYAFVNVDQLLEQSGLSRTQIEDPDVWFTPDRVKQFYDTLVDLLKRKDIAYEAGRYALEQESRSMGIFKSYLLALGSPNQIYQKAGEFAARIDRSTIYEINEKGKNKVEIIARPIEGFNSQSYQCENRVGNIQQVPAFCGRKLKQYEHEQCVNKGHELCRYFVSWNDTRSSIGKKIRNYAIPFVFLIPIIIPWFVDISSNTPEFQFKIPSLITIGVSVGIGLILALIIGWGVEYIEKKELMAELDSKTSLSMNYDRLLERSNVNYEISVITQKIGQAVGGKTDIDDIIRSVLKVIEDDLDYNRGLILLEDTDNHALEYKDGFGYLDNDLNTLRSAEIYLNRPSSFGLTFVRVFKTKQTIVSDQSIDKTVLSMDDRLVDILWAGTTICCPILYGGESLGVLAVFHHKKKREIVQRDINILEGISPIIGMVIHPFFKNKHTNRLNQV